MINFRDYEETLASEYVLSDSWEEDMIEAYVSADDFISNNGIEVARLVADDCFRYTPVKYPEIKVIAEYITTNGIGYDTRKEAEEAQKKINELKGKVLNSLDDFIYGLNIDDEELLYSECKIIDSNLSKIKLEISNGQSSIPISVELSDILYRLAKNFESTNSNLFAPGWWFIKDNGFILVKDKQC
jgi:hypothetical protein